MSSFCARSANVTARRARAHDRVRVRVYYYAVYSINTVQYPTGKNKKEGTDTLTLVNVFILYTHCHKYRIYFFIPSLGVNQIGSTNFSRVLAYSRTRVL